MTSARAAQSLGGRPPSDAAGPSVVLHLGRAAGLLLLVALPACALLLVARRWVAAAQPLDAALLLPAAMALVLVAWLARRLADLAEWKPRRGAPLFRLATTSASLLVFGLALGATRAPWWSAMAYWAIIVCEEGWAWSFAAVGRNSFRSLVEETVRAVRTVDKARSATPLSPIVIGPTLGVNERLTQQYTRLSLGEGREIIRGALHITVPGGARTATTHVAFCPPFAERPHLDVRVAAGPHCRLKVAQLLPQGARIEIRLAAPLSAAQRLSLEFTAHGQELVLRDETQPTS